MTAWDMFVVGIIYVAAENVLLRGRGEVRYAAYDFRVQVREIAWVLW